MQIHVYKPVDFSYSDEEDKELLETYEANVVPLVGDCINVRGEAFEIVQRTFSSERPDEVILTVR